MLRPAAGFLGPIKNLIIIKMNKKLISDELYVEDRLKRMKPVTDYDMTVE